MEDFAVEGTTLMNWTIRVQTHNETEEPQKTPRIAGWIDLPSSLGSPTGRSLLISAGSANEEVSQAAVRIAGWLCDLRQDRTLRDVRHQVVGSRRVIEMAVRDRRMTSRLSGWEMSDGVHGSPRRRVGLLFLGALRQEALEPGMATCRSRPDRGSPPVTGGRGTDRRRGGTLSSGSGLMPEHRTPLVRDGGRLSLGRRCSAISSSS